ncbi:EamA family transporter [Nguyenibacter vanlangensis]|uniref:DMT family transporter n=1 Tax=Nguyenibacter vanlangensis TaxID=1216886 RepID=A0A7Y7M5T8_9PROT|nr:DMT family transporter [Nguyenibacter vanlangensis]
MGCEGREIACLVSLGFFNTALAYVVYFRLIHVAGATFAALNNYLVPPLGLFFGWFLLGEDVKSTIWIGLILIISGVILVRKSQARA